jgi:hypothetical protein
MHETFTGVNPAMSEKHVDELIGVYTALFHDALYAYPTLKMDFERDLTRLLRSVERRGIRVFLVDLPAVAKHLDRCLDNGQYIPSGLPLTKRSSRGVAIPQFLRGLYLLVFDTSGRLMDDADTQAVFFLRQILSGAKKTDLDCSVDKVVHEMQNFVEVDESLPELCKFWGSEPVPSFDEIGESHDRVILGNATGFFGYGKSEVILARLRALPARKCKELRIVLAALDFMSGAVTSTLGSYDPNQWKFRHGPGAISEKTGPSNKYCWNSWPDSLEFEFPIADHGYYSYGSWADRANRSQLPSSEELESRMVAVPKDFRKPRLIAAEPAANMWCQQNLAHYFAERCRESWIGNFVRFTDQRPNQHLCTLGSLDGSLATIDLSMASDRVTCHCVGQLFRSNPRLLRALRASRTRSVRLTRPTRLPRGVEFVDRSVRLRKFSTMGNACTFPVESLLFFTIAVAATLVSRRLRPCMKNVLALTGEVAVFGDDIVIPVDSRELVVEALELLWFKVNESKSFWNGNFRESCGVDSFRGVNVTPAYWKTPYDGGPDTLASVVATSNNFYQKFLLRTAAHLASTLPGVIPYVAERSGVFGLKSRLPVTNPHHKVRVNDDLQRYEIRALTSKSSQTRSPTNDDSALFQFFIEEPGQGIPWTHGFLQRPRSKTRMRWVSLEEVTERPHPWSMRVDR